MSYQAGHTVSNVVSSWPYVYECYSLYSNVTPMSNTEYEYNKQEDMIDPVVHALTCQTNNSQLENSSLNFSNISDSDSYYTESRPSSTQMNENELGSNCSMNTVDDLTYLLSLPNSNDWTLAPSQNLYTALSPASSSYTDSRSSPVTSEISFYDDLQTFKVPVGGRRTPPPPYRPPVNSNIDISCKNSNLENIPSNRLRPPPPYMLKNTIKCRTIGTPSGISTESGFSKNFSLTADQIQSAVTTSGNCWSNSPSPTDLQTVGFSKERAVNEASKEVLVPGDPELWNKEHISHWLTRIENYYGIGHIDRSHMPQDGFSLCRLSTEDFFKITGDRRIAEILSNYMDCLKQNAKSLPSKSSQESCVKTENNSKTFFEAIKQVIGKSSRNKSSSASGGGQIQLWQFLLELLVDPKHSSLIAWEDEDGTFRLLDPEGTAKLWGQRKFSETKSKKPMNYDKLSRSLRHYYMKGIVNKVYGRRYTYKFHLDGVLRACSPSGVSDSIFIYRNFDFNICDNSLPRNFNLNLKQ